MRILSSKPLIIGILISPKKDGRQRLQRVLISLELLRIHMKEDGKVICDDDWSVRQSFMVVEKVQGLSPMDVINYV